MAEAAGVTNDELLSRWQALYVRYTAKNSTAEEKSQTLREMLNEIQYHLKLGRISEPCYNALHTKYTKEFTKLTQRNSLSKENDAPLSKNTDKKAGQIGNGDNKSNTNYHEPEYNASPENERVQKSSLNSKAQSEVSSYHRNVQMSKSSNDISRQNSAQGSSGASGSLSTSAVDLNRIVIDSDENSPNFDVESPQKMPSRNNQTQSLPESSRIIPEPKKKDQSLLNLWTTTKKNEKKDNPLFSRPDKRKYESSSPVSKKAQKHNETGDDNGIPCGFLTAREQLQINQLKKNPQRQPSYGGHQSNYNPVSSNPPVVPSYGKGSKSLGTRRGLTSKFVPPVPGNTDSSTMKQNPSNSRADSEQYTDPIYQDERLKNCEPRMIELILNEILDNGQPMTWDDIAGLEFAKKTIQEIVVWPMLRPDIFTGLRGPPKGLLLFGPPGTGKTLIGKCIASQSKSTFFTISASSLTSKWVGEGEKMVRTLFSVARCYQPAVVFIDEIDSLLSQRSDTEHESSRRIKTEFLVQLDGACTGTDERLLVIGATNRPQEIDEAARRRFVKRLYIPLPEQKARCQIVKNLLRDQKYELEDSELENIGTSTDGYSGADMANLCREAALGPIRSIPFGEIGNISADDVRAIQYCDFQEALEHVKASVSDKDLDMYIDWNNKFGSGRR